MLLKKLSVILVLLALAVLTIACNENAAVTSADAFTTETLYPVTAHPAQTTVAPTSSATAITTALPVTTEQPLDPVHPERVDSVTTVGEYPILPAPNPSDN